MICNYFSEPSWFIFASDLPALVYYSHIPTILVAFLIGLFVYLNGRKLLINQLLFAITACFSLWVFFDLIAWTNIHSDEILFVWSFFNVLQGLIAVLSVYFIYVFVTKKDASVALKSIFLLLLLPILVFAPTYFNLGGFNITNCDGFEFLGLTYEAYLNLVGVISLLGILVVCVKGAINSSGDRRKEILLLGSGIGAFIVLFFGIVNSASYLANISALSDPNLEMYGLFGMDIFAIVLAYLVVRFKAFNAKLLAAQALVLGLIVLVGSLVFFETSYAGDVIVGITFILACIGGYFLVRSVKKEVEQREQIEKLATDLQRANERLKELDKMKSEFVSIASHQLRSPITAIRGYISMLVEGSYGKFPDKAQEVLERIGESSKFMATSIEDYLNVSRIEAGNMKYELSDFNLKEQTEKVSDELRQVAMKKGLVLVFRSDVSGSGVVRADIGKTRQVIMNFIDNSIKYTPKGTITVVAHDNPKQKKMWVTISDTGIGMSKETLSEVFDKFVRAKNANQVNVTGTGLGLFVAKKMADGMGGRVWAESEGDGKGSSFHIEFPELPGKANPA